MKVAQSLVHQFYAALDRGEAAAALALLDPQVSWTEAENSPYYTGEVVGVENVVATVINPIMNDFDHFRVIPVEFIVEDNRVAVFGRYTGRNKETGKALRAAFVHSWTIRGGVLVRFVQHTNTAAWAEAKKVDATKMNAQDQVLPSAFF